MAAKIISRFIELTYEAALKSFWRRDALRKFTPFDAGDTLRDTRDTLALRHGAAEVAAYRFL
jgi:hypothetical protein